MKTSADTNFTFKITNESFQCMLRIKKDSFFSKTIKGEIDFLLYYTKLTFDETIDLVFSYLAARFIQQIKVHIISKNQAHFFSKHTQNREIKIEQTKFGYVSLLWQKSFCGVYFLHVKPHKSIPPHIHKRTQEAEIALTPGLHLQGKPLKTGISHEWPFKFPHYYQNKTDHEQIILCINHPSFDPKDEIEQDIFISQCKPPSEAWQKIFW